MISFNTKGIAIISTITLFIIVSSCCNTKETIIDLSKPEILHLNSISSASGIEFNNNNYYVVGDDNPWLHVLNKNLEIVEQIQISSIDTLVEGRTPKKIKADFECIGIDNFNNKTNLVIISSGSTKDSRDTAYIVDINNYSSLLSKNIRPLFEEIKRSAKLSSNNEINVEGLAYYEEHVYLFHRGNISENFVAKMKSEEFRNYILSDTKIPGIEIYWFDLPQHNNIPSGFSGACTHPYKPGIIFTASMEDTKTEVDDGVVSGSYIGYIPISDIADGNYSSSLLTIDNQPLAKKIESVCVIQKNPILNNNGKLKLVCVCDNDDGTSDIIKLTMGFFND